MILYIKTPKDSTKKLLELISSVKLQDTKSTYRTSLVAQWLRILLPMQETRVQALVWEDHTCRRATKPASHNYWTCALEPASHNYWAHVPQLLKPVRLEPKLRNKRSHHNEKPVYHSEEKPLSTTTSKSLHEDPIGSATKTQQQRPNAAKNK